MKRFASVLLALAGTLSLAIAQIGPVVTVGSAPSGSCNYPVPVLDKTSGVLYVCDAVTATWTPLGAPSGVPGASGQVLMSNGSNGFLTDAGLTYDAATDVLTVNAEVHVQNATGDWNGDGTDENTRVAINRVSEMLAHAALYGDPAYYTAPAVYDQWLDIFAGKPALASYSTEEAEVSVTKCYTTSCNSFSAYICVDSLDPDADGTNEIDDNAVIYVGDATTGYPKGRTWAVSRVDGDGTATIGSCNAGDYRITVWNRVDEDDPKHGIDQDNDGTVDAGAQVTAAWKNYSHPVNGIYYMIGYRLGYAPRMRDGSHGRNLLRNGEMEHDTTVKNWTRTGGATLAAETWRSTPNTTPFQCWQGDGTADCMYASGTSLDAVYSDDWIDVSPGARLVLTGQIMGTGGTTDYVTLATDTNNDGTLETNTVAQHTWRGNYWYGYRDAPWWFWSVWEIPSDVDRVKIYFSKLTGTLSKPLIDDLMLRRVRTWLTDESDDGGTTDTSLGSASFLINDPGERNIVLTGDSWTAATRIEEGLEDALEERFGRNIDTQVMDTGVGGYTAQNVIDNWDTLVAQYDPLYVVFSVGNNEANGATTVDDYIGDLLELVRLSRMIGAIPIFLSVPPTGGDSGAGSVFEKAHEMRDRQRRVLLGLVP